MFVLIVFAFFAGIVTILSPCILPLLPIILASSSGEGKKRPWGIITGFVLSFTLATLLLSTIVKATGLSADSLRSISIVVLIVFGLTLIIPKLTAYWESLTSRFGVSSNNNRSGFVGGFLVGLSLGLLWTPCVGPILASVITLAASSTVTAATFLITFSYAVGTAIPLFAIINGSSWFISRFDYLKRNSSKIQKAFGVVMILTALALANNLDRRFQSYFLQKFPSYGTGLTKLEETETVSDNIEKLQQQGGKMNSLPEKGPAPEITGGGNWINLDDNSSPPTLASLRGKVVLIDFWTYSCVNCIRTLPYLKAWDKKYRDEGLVIIGVHAPEFEFEKNLDNVKKAVKDFEIEYPVVQDNDFKIWRSYNNHYWPAKYLVDKNGDIRYTHFGEGDYDKTEEAIQELLLEAGKTPDTTILDMPEHVSETRSPETYVGYGRIANVVSSPSVTKDQLTVYSSPTSFPTNGIGFDGGWTVKEEYAQPESDSSLLFRFDAKEVNLVMAPNSENSFKKVEIYIDEELSKTITVDSDRLYNLVELDEAENHVIKILFPEGNVKVYAFTFG